MGFQTEDCDRPAGSHNAPAAGSRSPSAPLVLVVEKTQSLSRAVGFLCEYLGVHVEAVGIQRDLGPCSWRERPIAVMAPADAPNQDGCDVLEIVAEYDRDLPVMLVMGRESMRLSGIAATEARLGLSAVQKMTTIPGIGDLTDFFVKAGRHRTRRSAG